MSYKIISGSLVENPVNLNKNEIIPYIEGRAVALNFVNSSSSTIKKSSAKDINISSDNESFIAHVKRENIYKFIPYSKSKKIIQVGNNHLNKDSEPFNDSLYGINTKKKSFVNDNFQDVYSFGSNSFSKETLEAYTDPLFKENGETKSEKIIESDEIYSIKNPYYSNDKIILSLGAFLEPLDIRESIQRKSISGIEAINSVKSSIGNFAFDVKNRSIQINNFFIKSNNTLEPYEDLYENRLDEGYSKRILGFQVSYENNDFVYSVSGSETIYSKPINPGFLTEDNFLIKPFKDIDDYNYQNFVRNENNEKIISGSDFINYFIDNKINRNTEHSFNENNTYTGTGYTYNQNNTIGTDSVIFRDLME